MNYQVFKHYKNQKNYIILDVCKLQTNDVWVDGIIYYSQDLGKEAKFVRPAEEFYRKFKRIKNDKE